MVSTEWSEKGGRGQVGVELLIVFVGTVLVAAVAASLMVGTAVTLQAAAQETGEESVGQVTDRVQVVSAWGEVAEDGTVDDVTLRVRTAPGAGSIDLAAASVRTVGDGVDAASTVEVADSDDAVLAGRGDIGYLHVYGDGGLDGGLAPGERVAVPVTTASGATTVYVVDVPAVTAGKSVVEL